MNHTVKKYFAVSFLLLLAAIQVCAAPEATARAASFSFDSIWFYRDGTKVVPEIGRRWLTVAFQRRKSADAVDVESANDSYIKERAKAVLVSHDRLTEYLYDPDLAEDACFFKMRPGLKPEEISRLISQLNQNGSVRYVHPTLVLNNRTYAYFDVFQMEWKTATEKAQREALLSAAHVTYDEKEDRYAVNVGAIPYFRALNLLAEDIRVLRVTPYLVELKPSINARLTLFMSGGNIGDSIPFSLTIAFSDRVSIDPSSIATLNLRPSEIQKELFDCVFDPYDYAKAVTKSPIVITGRVRFYAPGEFTIPPVRVSYTCPSCSSGANNAVRAIETEPVLFKVSSIIPKEKSENRLIVPTDPVAPDFRLDPLHRESQRYRRLAVISFAGLVPCALWLLLLRRKAVVERKRFRERQNIEQLAGQLHTLLQDTPTVPHWSYLARIGAMLREYLVLLYGIDVKYKGGSGRQFMETVGAHVPGECSEPLGAIFSAIDTAVALESEQYQDMERLRSDILKIVDLTGHGGAARG